jgi:hypothetical protein
VKLTCHDIHTALKPHEKYSNVTTFKGTGVQDDKSTNNNYGRKNTPLLLFYLNHPIQFAQVIGVVVTVEEYFEQFWLFTMDDSSGATIDVTCPKPVKEKPVGALPTAGAVKSKPPTHDQDQEDDTTREHHLQSTLSTLTIGTVLQAKGTLTTFRSTRQLSLLRLTILPSTTHEIALITSRTQFYTSTLSKPWLLSRTEEKKLRMEAQGEKEDEIEAARHRKKRTQKKREREERHRKIIEQEYEREEEERKTGAEEARKWGEELKEKNKKRKLDHLDKEREEVWTTVE